MSNDSAAGGFTVDHLREAMARLSEAALMADASRRLPEIRTSTLFVEQWRFPATKKRRVRNKWAKRPKNWRPLRVRFHDTLNGVYYMHPDMKTELFDEINRENHGL